jgi:hypothetical protein
MIEARTADPDGDVGPLEHGVARCRTLQTREYSIHEAHDWLS